MKTIDASLSIEERRKAFLHELRTTSMDQVKRDITLPLKGIMDLTPVR